MSRGPRLHPLVRVQAARIPKPPSLIARQPLPRTSAASLRALVYRSNMEKAEEHQADKEEEEEEEDEEEEEEEKEGEEEVHSVDVVTKHGVTNTDVNQLNNAGFMTVTPISAHGGGAQFARHHLPAHVSLLALPCPLRCAGTVLPEREIRPF